VLFLNRRELEIRKVNFVVDLPPGDIDFQNSAIQQASALHAEGGAELLNEMLGEIRVRGHLKVGMKAECDRCLEPVPVQIDSDFDLFYRSSEFETSESEHALDAGEAEIAFYEGEGLELNDVLREHVLLSLPMQLVCSEGCQGICPVCGRNRNLGDCGCQTRPADDRWSALREVRGALKPGNGDAA
jgi:uncharacterized protein